MSGLVRAAVVGCGKAGGFHALAYTRCPLTTLELCVDLDREKALALAAQCGAVAETPDRLASLLVEHRIELVSVCTWAKNHPASVLSIAPAEGLLGILCEKPLALTAAEAAAMVECCEKHNVLLAVGLQRRFSRQHLQVRHMIRSGVLGRVEEVVIQCPFALVLMHSHTLDLVRFYLERELELVHGSVGTKVERYGELRDLGCKAEFRCRPDGPPVLLNTIVPEEQKQIWIRGTNGVLTVEIDGGIRGYVRTTSGADLLWNNTTKAEERQRSFDEQIHTMATAIRSQKPGELALGADGLAVATLIEQLLAR